MTLDQNNPKVAVKCTREYCRSGQHNIMTMKFCFFVFVFFLFCKRTNIPGQPSHWTSKCNKTKTSVPDKLAWELQMLIAQTSRALIMQKKKKGSDEKWLCVTGHSQLCEVSRQINKEMNWGVVSIPGRRAASCCDVDDGRRGGLGCGGHSCLPRFWWKAAQHVHVLMQRQEGGVASSHWKLPVQEHEMFF